MSANQSFVHGMRSPLRANMVHLCRGYVIHNYLLGPRVVLVPIPGSYSILLRHHSGNCAVNIAGYVTVGEDVVHPFLPVVPVVIRQVASLREPIDSRIFFRATVGLAGGLLAEGLLAGGLFPAGGFPCP